MQNIPYCNILEIEPDEHTAICVTTNGIVKSNGCAVMGRGLALQFDIAFAISRDLGTHLKTNGNIPADLGYHVNKQNNKTYRILTFPTKHHWSNPSDINLIAKSAKELMRIADKNNLTKIYTARPGCGLGQLNWGRDIETILENILDDRFYIISPERDK